MPVWTCEICQEQCATEFKLQRHVDSAHYPRYKCATCGLSYENARGRALHVKSVHGKGSQPHLCDRCGGVYKNCNSFDSHMSKYHR